MRKNSEPHLMPTLPITVTVLTKNSQLYLRQVLASLVGFDEVLVCDTGSKDATLSITRDFSNVSVYERPFIGFGPTHNVASALAKHDWVLSIDSDEVMSSELVKEIMSLSLEKGSVYSLNRRNRYRGKWIKGCGWHPDQQIRLYNRLETRFDDAQVHESILVGNLKTLKLQGALDHYTYDNVSDFLKKMQSYSDLFAIQHQGQKHSSLSKALLHGAFAFFKSYVLKRGFLDGSEGLEISAYNANTAFYKYLKLAEKNKHSKSWGK